MLNFLRFFSRDYNYIKFKVLPGEKFSCIRDIFCIEKGEVVTISSSSNTTVSVLSEKNKKAFFPFEYILPTEKYFIKIE